MSDQSSSFTTSSSSFSYSSSSSNSSGMSTGTRSSQHTYTDPQGNTTVKTTNQNLGEPAVQDTRYYGSDGQERLGTSAATSTRRIEDVSDEEQAKNDREYEERMEDEYAKREGGA